jgi:magnesium chelatase family protein
MALARLLSRGQSGIEAYEVLVEVHLAGGLPGFSIVGLPTTSVRESKDRVRAALQTSGHRVPASRITAHLGPAEIPKDGGRFDLAIALALVKADRELGWQTDSMEFLGELSLGGEVRGIHGVLPATLAAHAAGRSLIVPAANAAEAAVVDGAEVYAASHLREVIDHLNGARMLSRVEHRRIGATGARCRDLSDVRGQPAAKRAVTVAAAGAHNLLMIGPPGSGKTMLAERLAGLLPALTWPEFLDSASLRSLAGEADAIDYAEEPPFRAPHHTISAQALVGGGSRPRPGEVSLAHLGVLFLDELPEFSRAAVEALREPLETGQVRISRVQEKRSFPARIQLIAAMNPCACGHFGDGTDRCHCTPSRIVQYRGRISGPLLDRFDLQIQVPRVSSREIGAHSGEPESPGTRRRIEGVRRRQVARQGVLNAHIGDAALWDVLELAPDATSLLQRTAERWELSARGAVRTLKLARTIADLADSDAVSPEHVAEALQLRCLERPASPIS